LIELRVPDGSLEGEDSSGSIVLWLYRDGSFVKQGDVVAEFMVEKVSIELQAPATGILHIKVEPEIPVSKGDVLALIEPR
jgi:pyruvate/2-oxoglutarate dehydrogenase complex dihydrolipoamide acyltransferase (E2) component